MQALRKIASGLVVLGLAAAAPLHAADQYGLTKGTPDIKTIGALAFGPAGILFAGDSQSGAVFALQTGDATGDPAAARYDVPGLNVKIAETLGADSQNVRITDLVVNPLSGNVFVAVMASGKPALVRVQGSEVTRVDLQNIPFAKAQLVDVPEDRVEGQGPRARNNRAATITDLAFVDGYLLVAGMNNSADPSAVRSIEFPFSDVKQGTSLEIYHGAHGRLENNATVRTFVPFVINGEANVLAGFTCTPLVRFPVSELKPGEKVRGTTVAELGNRNQPLDMIAYQKGGKTWILSANTTRGVMKINTDRIGENPGISSPVGGGGTAGQTYDRIDEKDAAWKGVVQLDKLNDELAVVLVEKEGGPQDLKSLPLP